MITVYHGSNYYIAEKQIKEKTAKLDPFNVIYLEEPTIEELNSELTVGPLFSARKIIVVRSIKKLPSDNKQIISVLENKKDTNHVFFIIDTYGAKYEQLSRYLKKFQVIKIPQFTDSTARAYLNECLRLLKLNFTDDVKNYFIYAIGTKPEEIDGELDSYIKLGGPTKPTKRDLDKYLTRRTKLEVFKITTFIYRDTYEKMLPLLILFIRENPNNLMELLNLIISDLRVGIMIKELKKNKYQVNQIPANPFRIKILKKRFANYDLPKLITFFCALNKIIYNVVRQGSNPEPFFLNAIYEFKEIR